MSNLDEALERFHLGDLEYAGGLANHGPMAAEALERLGHPALIPAFLGLYAPRLPIAESGRVLPDGEAQRALGDATRGSDWVATYEARLAGGDWREVVAEAAPGLMPGLFAGAGHGLLRTGHAVRSLEREDSPLRRRELARGLAYWSARFQTLPGQMGRGEPRSEALEETLRSWPLSTDTTARTGFFFERVRRLDGFAPFGAAIESMAPSSFDDPEDFLTRLCLGAASLYLDHPEARIAYVHALTIPAAVRLILPFLAEREARAAAFYGFQASAALHSISGESEAGSGAGPEAADDEVVRIAEDWNEIRYHAACSLQEHSIKMVEACWREDERAPDPAFRRAAADAALKIDARGQAAEC